jgi:lipopolysaccharide cholinephosphotransferase
MSEASSDRSADTLGAKIADLEERIGELETSIRWLTDPGSPVLTASRSLLDSTMKADREHFRTLFWQLYRQEGESGLGARERFHQSVPAGSGSLRTLQLALTWLLEQFDAIASKHGIEYWLCGGTQLGALRNGGFIPWDNDVDVYMMEDQFDRLQEALKAEPGFFVENYTKAQAVNVDVVKYLPRFRPALPTTGVASPQYKAMCKNYIDIFMFSYTDEASDAAVVRLKTLQREMLKEYRALRKTSNQFAGVADQERQRIVREFLLPYRERQRLLMNPAGGRDFICPPIINNHRVRRGFFLDASVVFPLKQATFERSVFPVANDVTAFVTSTYGGDIWDLPQDIGHVRNRATEEDIGLMAEYLAEEGCRHAER